MSTKSTTSSGRYVFFTNLKEGAWLYPALTDARNRLATISGEIGISSAYDASSKKYLDRIKKYLDFVQSMANNLSNNEIDFLKQQALSLNDPLGEEINTTLQGFKSGIVDYPKIISLFNKLFQDQKKYEQYMSSELKRMRDVSDTYTEINSTVFLKTLTDYYETQYKKYAGIIAGMVQRKTRTKDENNKWIDNYGKSISEQLSLKANAIIKGLASDDEFISQFSLVFKENDLQPTTDDIRKKIIDLVADRLLNEDLDINPEELIEKIKHESEKNMQEVFDSIKDAEFSRIVEADVPQLEEIALSTNKNLGEFLQDLDSESLERIKKVYPETKDVINKFKKFKNLNTSSAQAARDDMSKVIRQAIKDRVSEILKRKITSKEKVSRAELVELKKIKDFITPTQIKKDLATSLKGVYFSHDMIGEILASKEVKEKIQNVIVNNLPGVSISFKADIRFSTGYVGSDVITIQDKHFSKIQSIINKVIKDNYSSFLIQYKTASGGQTNINAAKTVYKNWLSQMKKQLDELIDSDIELAQRFSDRTKLYEEFYKTFSNSISVKDYVLYNNELGFHGGSLGSKTAPEKVIDNITEMYTLGGISNTDAEELLFAVINCGEAMIGSGLKPSLEQYLLGGAALIMFDDSFAASDTFLQQLTDQFKGQRIVNLYRINQHYIPASFVLQDIYNNLINVYQNLNSEMQASNIRAHNNVTITNNITLETAEYSGDTPQQRAESLSTYALSHISIQFSFMGGLMDIIEKELGEVAKIN